MSRDIRTHSLSASVVSTAKGSGDRVSYSTAVNIFKKSNKFDGFELIYDNSIHHWSSRSSKSTLESTQYDIGLPLLKDALRDIIDVNNN